MKFLEQVAYTFNVGANARSYDCMQSKICSSFTFEAIGSFPSPLRH